MTTKCPLTYRQLDVLRHAPLDTAEMAKELDLSQATIRNYIRNIADVLLDPGDPREKRRSKIMVMTLALQAGYITVDELVTLPPAAARGVDTKRRGGIR